ncbi:hypothetical protein GCM10011575_46820 [Microlunatus endophyticus]|uniref:FtsX-like permease family protein n=1 Tax=Microlunatus endophyticus TaxID=1716077 RepID=A0A917W8I6_9ACTN|nr:hypothetical protein [Microlunatus endophyticus]GGL83153.1 hypothetical protein GCM10011575_46820 [Microlunatus endophyticus]
MIALRLWWLLLRRQSEQRLVIMLAVIAFAVSTGALLTVLGGLGAFTARNAGTTGGLYVLLAQIATVILVIPVVTLGGSAARLAISRRDDRLAALRLAGATSGQIGIIAITDAGAQALAGAIVGIGLYLAALPGVAMINFQGRPFRWSELLVSPGLLAVTVAGVVLLATASAVLTLARIAISPLGVARRTSPKSVSAIRVAIAIVVLVAWVPVTKLLGSSAGLIAGMIVFGLCFAVLNLIGPFVLGLIGRLSVNRANSVPKLLAARRLTDDPRATWRPVAGVTLATFITGVLSIGPAIAAQTSPGDPDEAHLPADMMTGSLLTLVIAALLAAVSVGVNQAARVYDLRDQYRMLHLVGTDASVIKQARMRETGLPLVASIAIAALVSLIIVAPFGVMLIGAAPGGIAMFAGGIVICLAMVLGAVALSQPLVDRVLASGSIPAAE